MMTPTLVAEGGSEVEEEQEVGDTQGTLITFTSEARESMIDMMERKPLSPCRDLKLFLMWIISYNVLISGVSLQRRKEEEEDRGTGALLGKLQGSQTSLWK